MDSDGIQMWDDHFKRLTDGLNVLNININKHTLLLDQDNLTHKIN